MTSIDERTAATGVAPQYHAVERPEDLTHLVCCRDYSWERALCGSETNLNINLGAEHFCTMCVEVYLGGVPEHSGVADTCPVDGRACPDDDELDELIRQRLDP